MKVWKGVCIFIAQVVLLVANLSAQEKSQPTIYQQIEHLAENYNGKQGVKMMVCNGGIKLQTVKMMLRKEFGKEFVDNIQEFAVLFYKEVQNDVADKITTELQQIATPLHKVDISKQLKSGTEGYGYVRLSEDGKTITDLLIVIKSPARRFIYFGGNFQAENIKYSRQKNYDY